MPVSRRKAAYCDTLPVTPQAKAPISGRLNPMLTLETRPHVSSHRAYHVNHRSAGKRRTNCTKLDLPAEWIRTPRKLPLSSSPLYTLPVSALLTDIPHYSVKLRPQRQHLLTAFRTLHFRFSLWVLHFRSSFLLIAIFNPSTKSGAYLVA